MGGARCAYRTCTARSEPSKKTHFFHFPVFDKVRCHQWITNAQRLEFLDLKISQLRNRVICQHHFRDDNFMNYMHNKLKKGAVPTENGPFCTIPANAEDDKELPINLDDIENDYLPKDEMKAHFSVKYGEFLTTDFSEAINLPVYNRSIKLREQGLIFQRKGKYRPTVEENNYPVNKKPDAKHIEDDNKTAISESVMFVPQLQQLPDPKVMAIEFEEINLTDPIKPEMTMTTEPIQQEIIEPKSFLRKCAKSKSTPIPSSKKVQIISEKKISNNITNKEPIKLRKSEFKPVSPSMILKILDKKKKQNVILNGTDVGKLHLNITNPEEMSNVQGFDSSNVVTSQNSITDQIYMNHSSHSQLHDTRPPVGQVIDNSLIQYSELFSDCNNPLSNVTTEANLDINLEQQSKLFVLDDLISVTTIPIEFNSPSSEIVPQNSTVLADLTCVQNNFTIADNQTKQNDSLLTESLPKMPLPFEEFPIVDVEQIKTNTNILENKKDAKMSTGTHHLTSVRKNKNYILKPKMPPEKLAAIEAKRKFNLKLRDVIESCFNKLDNKTEASKLAVVVKRSLNDKIVANHLSENTNLPNPQENQIAYVAARLQRMEDILLNKIEQNSQKIKDLKKTIKPALVKKSAFTQTCSNPETTKRNLYQQISQYLSPETRSLLYEELFINSAMEDKSDFHVNKKRRKI